MLSTVSDAKNDSEELRDHTSIHSLATHARVPCFAAGPIMEVFLLFVVGDINWPPGLTFEDNETRGVWDWVPARLSDYACKLSLLRGGSDDGVCSVGCNKQENKVPKNISQAIYPMTLGVAVGSTTCILPQAGAPLERPL